MFNCISASPSRLNVEVKYDLTFESHFGDDAPNVVRRVVAHATNMYTWPTLDIPLTWSVSNYNVIPESGVYAIGGWLKVFNKFKTTNNCIKYDKEL